MSTCKIRCGFVGETELRKTMTAAGSFALCAKKLEKSTRGNRVCLSFYAFSLSFFPFLFFPSPPPSSSWCHEYVPVCFCHPLMKEQISDEQKLNENNHRTTWIFFICVYLVDIYISKRIKTVWSDTPYEKLTVNHNKKKQKLFCQKNILFFGWSSSVHEKSIFASWSYSEQGM